MMRRFLALMMVACLVLLGVQLSVGAEQAHVQVNVGSLKGPTTMGLSKMIQDHENGDDYAFTMAGTPDELAPMLAKGELDIALIPCNLAAVLNQRMEGGLQVAAINTLGVLYIVEKGDGVHDVADLKGKTLLSTGKGTTPEYALNHVLSVNGIDPGQDLVIDYRSEATEVAALLESGTQTLAMLPQPFVTAVLTQNKELRVALSLTQAWADQTPEGALVTGVVAVRKAFAEAHLEQLKAFMDEYAASTQYVNDNPVEAAQWIEALGIAKAPIAEQAIPACNIVCITGDEMVQKVSGYLAVLYAQNPQSVGGALPNEAFYLADIAG